MTQHTPTRFHRPLLAVLAGAMLVAAVAAAPLAADSAAGSSRSQVSRSSGSSSRGSASSRGGASSTRSGGSVSSRSSGSSHTSSRGAVVTRPSYGQPGGSGSHGGYHGHHGSYGHYGSYYDFRFGWFGYYPYWAWGYPYYGYGYYPPVVYASTPSYGMGALDLNIQPKQTEVYVNGQYVGLVKQYDGFPGYLWLESGVYEIAFYRPGFATVTREFEIFTGMVLDVSIDMQPGEAIQPQRPEPRPADAGYRGYVPREPASEVPTTPAPPAGSTVSGRVGLSIEPIEASVYLDGRFVGTGRELAGGLDVDSGQHIVEVVLPGYEQETVRFEVKPDSEARVDVRLEPTATAGG